MVNIKHFLVLCTPKLGVSFFPTWLALIFQNGGSTTTLDRFPPPNMGQISKADQRFRRRVHEWIVSPIRFFFLRDHVLEVNLGNVKLSEDPFLAASFQSKHPPALPIHQEVWDPGCMTWCINTLVSDISHISLCVSLPWTVLLLKKIMVINLLWLKPCVFFACSLLVKDW